MHLTVSLSTTAIELQEKTGWRSSLVLFLEKDFLWRIGSDFSITVESHACSAL